MASRYSDYVKLYMAMCCILSVFFFWSDSQHTSNYYIRSTPHAYVTPPDHEQPVFTDVTRTGDGQPPLLTLFTTMTQFDPRFNRRIYLNTLKNWASMLPWLQPVLFVKDVSTELKNTSSWGYQARMEGWRVQAYSRTLDGAPVLKAMFADALELKLHSHFIGYANPNILFPKSIRDNLNYFEKMFVKTNMSQDGILISGFSRKVPLRLFNSIDNAFDPEMVETITAEREISKTTHADYFITTDGGIPWTHVPDFVVGRPMYDFWIVQKAIDWKLIHVDASETLRVGNQAFGIRTSTGGTTNISPNWYINMDMLGQDIIFHRARHTCAEYFSWFNESCLMADTITVSKRDEDKRRINCLL